MKLLKLNFALLSLSTIASAFGALPGTNDPSAVNLAQSPGQFILGVTGYYLKPSPANSDLDYASVSGIPENNSINVAIFGPKTNYEWGYGVNVGYIFANTPYDMNLSYFHLDTGKFNDFINAQDSIKQAIDVGPDSVIVGNARYDSASEEAEYTFNHVDLTAGKYINYGCRVRIHPNIGVRYASLDRELNSLYVLNPTTATSRAFFGSTSIEEESDFQGFGPLIGVDGSFYLGAGFGAVGHADYALLYGRDDTTTHQIDVFNLTIPAFSTLIFPTSFKNDDNDRLAQAADLKLGGDYTYLFNQNNNANLTLELGYQYSQYFDAIDRLESQSRINIVNGVISISKDTTVRAVHTSNVGLHGPYATLTLHV